MKLLIVDDNRYVVEGLKRQLDWDAFGIDQVFGCYSVKDAEEILTRNPIDFLISDIEMPGQDGFALLEWLRQRGSEIEVVLLTSYTDFSYAQRSVGYKVSQYLLKPLDSQGLEAAVRDMVQQHQIREKKKQLMEYGSQWISQQNRAKAQFWGNLLSEIGPGSPSQNVSRSPGVLPYPPTKQLTVVLIFFDTGAEVWQDEMLRFLCNNALGEISDARNLKFESAYTIQAGQLAAVFQAGEADAAEVEGLVQDFESFIKAYFLFGVSCYIFAPCCACDLREHLLPIRQICGENVDLESARLIEPAEHPAPRPDYQPPYPGVETDDSVRQPGAIPAEPGWLFSGAKEPWRTKRRFLWLFAGGLEPAGHRAAAGKYGLPLHFPA